MNGSSAQHDQGAHEHERELRVGRTAVALTISLLFTLPLLADTAAHWFGWRAFFLADAKIQLVLATLVHVGGGAGYYAGAFRTPRRGSVLAAVAGAIYVYGTIAVFTRPEYAGIAFKVSTAAVTLALLIKLLRMVQGPPLAAQQQHPNG